MRMAATTASSGWKRTSPSASPQTKPTGNPRRSSPRAALLRMPPLRRARRTCNSASLMAPFRPEQEPIVEKGGMVDAVGVADQRIGQAAQFDEPIPVGVVAGQSGYLEPEHEADMGERDFGGQSGEPRSRDKAGAGQPEVLVDDDDAIGGPAEFTGLSAEAYCRSVDSRLCSTWAQLDWRR